MTDRVNAAPPLVSVVIPCYNEEKRLGPTLGRVLEYLGKSGWTWELVIVDDGCTDGTVALARALAPTARLLSHRPNRGKGYAVRRGMLAAGGEFVLFTDSDLATPIEHLADFLAAGQGGAPVVIGTRKTAEAVVETAQPWLRRTMSRAFQALSNCILGTRITDTTCGFKLFRRDAAQAIFARQTIEDWSFDSEIMAIARLLGYPITEIPVHWADSRATKVRLVRDTAKTLLGLLRIRRNIWAGRYREAQSLPAEASSPLPPGEG